MPSGKQSGGKILTFSSKARRKPDAWLFPQPIVTMAQTRNLCGDYFEDLTATIGHAKRVVTSGEVDYCPDLIRSENIFYECKSVGCNGSSIIYSSRLKKDQQFVGSGEDRMLFYWFWRHNLPVKTMRDVPTLRRRLGESIRAVVVLPLFEVVRIAGGRTERMLNRSHAKDGRPLGYGKQSSGYGLGVSIPFLMLQNACNHKQTVRDLLFEDRVLAPIDVFMMDRFEFVLDAPREFPMEGF